MLKIWLKSYANNVSAEINAAIYFYLYAFIVKKDKSLTVKQVKQHCQQSLTHYEIPKKIYFIDALPKMPIGKVSRKMLKEQFGDQI